LAAIDRLSLADASMRLTAWHGPAQSHMLDNRFVAKAQQYLEFRICGIVFRFILAFFFRFIFMFNFVFPSVLFFMFILIWTLHGSLFFQVFFTVFFLLFIFIFWFLFSFICLRLGRHSTSQVQHTYPIADPKPSSFAPSVTRGTPDRRAICDGHHVPLPPVIVCPLSL
jgi:hypothetical protein